MVRPRRPLSRRPDAPVAARNSASRQCLPAAPPSVDLHRVATGWAASRCPRSPKRKSGPALGSTGELATRHLSPMKEETECHAAPTTPEAARRLSGSLRNCDLPPDRMGPAFPEGHRIPAGRHQWPVAEAATGRFRDRPRSTESSDPRLYWLAPAVSHRRPRSALKPDSVPVVPARARPPLRHRPIPAHDKPAAVQAPATVQVPPAQRHRFSTMGSSSCPGG
ncbi:hypothetical protein MBUL_02645 [Methylobacterium bullatum]|uniref:Uncharacterized protein n=1 Tax=Methylobacterium bullatum TaxID=570505 RepID=A0A679J4A6_9HYPH|nr:hypothetical protein MBUL_02645 [Methylobacterium bullatum]